MKKIILASMFCLSLVSAQAQTEITYTNLNQFEKEQADHWGLDEREWLSYKKYMAIEGDYFYKQLDPLHVISMITKDSGERQRYIEKHIMFERDKIAKEIAFANDVWRVQQHMFGDGPLMDFQKLPWMDGKAFDRRTIKQNLPQNENIHKANNANKVTSQQYSEPESSYKTTLNEVVASQQYSEPVNKIEFLPEDELWVLFDNECKNCKPQIATLVNEQPLKVVIVSLIKDAQVLKNWVEQSGLNQYLNSNKARLELFDPLMFDPKHTPAVGQVYHARNGHVLRNIE